MKSVSVRLRLASFCALATIGTIALMLSTSARPQGAPARVYVWASAGGANNGTSWTDAFTTLTAALSAAAPNSHLWIASGTYYPPNVNGFVIPTQLKLYGGFNGTETTLAGRNGDFLGTVLDGNIPTVGNALHVVKISGLSGTPAVVIDGFRITNGVASGSSPDDDGAGIYSKNSDLDLANCFIDHNFAFHDGGGLFIEGGGVTPPSGAANRLHIKLCEFKSNEADDKGGAIFGSRVFGHLVNTSFLVNHVNVDGGAVFLWQQGTGSGNRLDFTSCVFQLNYATGGASSKGGAVCLDESGASPPAANVEIVNCTFSQNNLQDNPATAPGQALYVSTNSLCTLTNSILWGNWYLSAGSPNPTPIHAVGSPVVTWSDVQYQGTSLGLTNLQVDPLFRGTILGGLWLQGTSPCIDHALYTALPADLLDVDDDGDTSEIIPEDLFTAMRFFDRPPNSNDGAPAGQNWLDMGAYEKKYP